jgi:hypothetical protein
VEDGRDPEAIAVIGHTGPATVEGQEGREEGEQAAGLEDFVVGLSADSAEIANPEQEEGDVDSEEEGEEDDGGPEGAGEADGGEDEPALDGLVSQGRFRGRMLDGKLTNRNRPNES